MKRQTVKINERTQCLKEANKMNRRKFTIVVVILIVTAMISAACGQSKSTGLTALNEWRTAYIDDYANVRITFEAGDKCTLEKLKPTTNNELAYEIVVNDQKYENYMVIAHTMDEGKTLQDLDDYVHKYSETALPPYFVNLESGELVAPMSQTFAYTHLPTGSIYFVCIIQGPDKQRSIEALGPIMINQ